MQRESHWEHRPISKHWRVDMADTQERAKKAAAALAGNEALFGMLNEEGASVLLEWGVEISTSVVNKTEGMDDQTADEVLSPKLKAVRTLMRSIGNWAAGQYAEPESRVGLRDKLLELFRIFESDEAASPENEALDKILNQVDETSDSQAQLILKLKQLIDKNKSRVV